MCFARSQSRVTGETRVTHYLLKKNPRRHITPLNVRTDSKNDSGNISPLFLSLSVRLKKMLTFPYSPSSEHIHSLRRYITYIHIQTYIHLHTDMQIYIYTYVYSRSSCNLFKAIRTFLSTQAAKVKV